MNILAEIDKVIGPVATAANRLRQVRDALPQPMWMLVPPVVRTPIEALFLAIETYDRKLGQLQALGLLRTPAEGHDNSQNAEKGDDAQSQ